MIAATAFGQPAIENLQKARQSIEALKYADAAKSLETAWGAPGSDRQTVLEILKLQAVVAATLGQQDRARSLFLQLLYLDPDYNLGEGDFGPKVTTLYFEARGRIAADGGLKFESGPVVRDGKAVRWISVQVTDTLGYGRKVRFHTRAPLLAWRESVVVPVVDDKASLSIEAPAVEWWAELLGEKDRVVSQVGSASQPIIITKEAPLTPRDPAGEVALGAYVPGMKTFAYIAGGAAVVAGVTGLVFGIRSNNEKNGILNAQCDANGKVIGITRERALQLNAQSRSSATIANAMYVTALVFAGAGVVLYLKAPDASISAGPGGVAVAGTF